MMGAGIFINTVELAKRAGLLGFLSYSIVGLLLLPLILSIAQLVRLHPEGGFFTYAQKELNPYAAFISTWGYFVGKLGSTVILTHTAVLLIQQIIPFFSALNALVLDSIILVLFILLNMLNLRTGRTIQAWLMAFKIVPVLFVILAGLYLFSGAYLTASNVILSGLPSSIPLALFTFLGFEATCSLSSKIENARVNGPRAILISYAIVIVVYSLYQFLFYASVGSTLAEQRLYLSAFPLLLEKLITPAYSYLVQALLNLAIAASALGGSYGILFSNSWNLHMLASNKYIPFSSFFAQLNAYYIPYVCVLAEGAVCLVYLCITQGAQVPLQLTSVLGSITAYTISILALLSASKKNKNIGISPWIIYLAIINCLILISFCLRNVFMLGLSPLFGFIAFLVLGIALFHFFIAPKISRAQ